jgi:hypothetical protein
MTVQNPEGHHHDFKFNLRELADSTGDVSPCLCTEKEANE